MLRVIREEEPTRPSAKLSTAEGLPTLAANRGTEPAKLTKLVRGELDWIVMKCLEKDRGRRYETASGLGRDIERYLADEPVQACPPSAAYRLRKFARRHRAGLAAAAGLLLAAAVTAASIGWALRDHAARAAEAEQEEAARRAKVEIRSRDSLNAARTLLAEKKLPAARLKLAEARAQLGDDRSALGSLAAEVEAAEAALNRFQEFLDRIDRAHEAQTTPVLEPALAAAGPVDGAAAPPPARTVDRQRAAAVGFLLKALDGYGVLERDGWYTALEGGILGRDQVEQVRRIAHEQLLWLADDVVRRLQEHRSGRKLSPQAAARAALVYLDRAAGAYRPTLALYSLRGRCRKALGEVAAARADRELAARTPPSLALDHSLRGQAAYDVKRLAEGVEAFEEALRLEPTHYWSLMKLGHCLCDLGRRPEDFAGAERTFDGCILKRPDHAHAYYCRALASFKRGRYEKAVADCSKAIELDPRHALAWNNRGVAHSRLGQREKALADYSRAIALDPELARAWYNRGSLCGTLEQFDKAVTDLSRALGLDSDYAVFWNTRGLVYFKQGQPAKAWPTSPGPSNSTRGLCWL
jgi:tetratricopeptide (TPR) repeat protein